MEKLEKHIKQKLESREITPSKKAWSRLEERLETPSKKRNNFKWYAIAAVFIGILMVTTIYFMDNDQEQQQTQIVVEDTSTTENAQERKEALEVITEKPSVAEIEKSLQQNDTEQLAELEVVTMGTPSETLNDKTPLETGLAENQQLVIDKKVDEVLAKVTLLESQKQSVTNAEVDSLLRAAQKEVLADKLFDQNGSVDAMALLAEVEDELDDSFRDQIFEALKEGYTKLRTAVADRNN